MPQTSELHVTICPKVRRPQPICIGPDKYKCQFCNRKGEYAALVAHVQTHEKTAVEFQEKKIYKCNLGCRKNSHYHCCCKRTIISRNNFTQHIHKCRLSLNTQVPTLSGSSLVSSTLPALLGHSALPVNTSVSICSDNNGSDPQCGKDGATGTFNVMSPSPLFSAASLTVSITPSDSKEYIMSVNPSHSLCAASFKEQTPRATRITCRFCNLSLNKKNVKSHMQRRHMSANPDLLQMNGISHTHIASGNMEDLIAEGITLKMLSDVRETVMSSPLGVIKTPMILCCQTTLQLKVPCNVYLKLENMQRTGSYKIRGVANQFSQRSSGGNFVTISAGNYGKSFAYASKHYGTKGKVVMPETAPISRSLLIKSFGLEVERVPTLCQMDVVNRCVQEEKTTFLHPYNDLDVIAGHASLGLEILEVLPNPDVVVVSCGGGALLAGVAAAIKLSGCDETRMYGVEPEGACTMYKSFIEKRPVAMDSRSIASGLAPPSAGALPYALCQKYVEEIVLVTDDEIKSAVSTLYEAGLVVEPSGSAAFAALVNNRIPDIDSRNVVVILSGGNISKDELTSYPD
ncbi:L-threonine dehydratase catabolic TdcB-like isoform 1-T3 [Clarias gariepinus]|uniref:L-threonine dehydratase catabolic TdcB n=1 Tax=Clarias gariepinus TaxID=13013 RepID=UPI00234C97FF|nr:L-threonine dehydratase catabolic TdcB [Clarias gariepinus]XP_053364483.1 L-threonine dehydratase catabolic TdcB [Clarias gariepinus]